ncbi:DUF4349 domain-containing protein [Kitasatospora sp. NPDC056327]|uniref:DUF4349 domain-containing protein n=1 Tax=Kitasatospora sp. NPDC056327 TaxID=3345785 RepID=UPI0035DD6CE2
MLAAVAATAALAAGCGAGAGGTKDMSAPAAAAAGEAAKGDAAPAAGPGAAASVAPKAAPGQATAAPGGGQPAGAPVVDTRQIAHSAQLSVRVEKVDEALARARGLAIAVGGYVANETVSGGTGGSGTGPARSAGTPPSGQVTVKVPSAAYQQTLDALAGLGEVTSRRSQAEDLTQLVADVNSRLQSQQASVDRVRALMAQAKTLAEIVSLEGELSRRESDLESLQKQVKELSARTSLSTVTLDVRERQDTGRDGPDVKEEDDGFWESVGSALGAGWHVLAVAVRGIFVALAAALPFLLVVAAVLWAVRAVRRRRGAQAPAGRSAGPAVPPVPAGRPAVPAPDGGPAEDDGPDGHDERDGEDRGGRSS